MLKRERYLNWLIKAKDTDFVKVITGVRRSGKSVILRQYHLFLEEVNVNKDNILYYNFEEPKNYHLNNYLSLYEDIKVRLSMIEGKVYFLFDEIQEVEDWQKLVNGLRVEFDCDITITGSNANLLSGELATYLAGRYIKMNVYPLSFKEVVTYKLDNTKESNDKLDKLFDEYLEYGGFPSLLTINDHHLKNDILSGNYNSILIRDVATRGQIRDIRTLNKLVEYLMDVIGSAVSINSIVNTFKSERLSVSNPTINNYVDLLMQSYIFYEANQYDIRGKKRLKTNSKYYVVDTGLRNNILKRVNNLGSQLENIIYIELKRRGYDVYVGDINGSEVDFVAFKQDQIEYIQVTYHMPKDDDREQRNLKHIKDNYKKTIITLNRMDVGSIEGIEVVHAIDWLMNTPL
ncbi:MAG: ATP-binding protein [Erysipelothrix sp.]|nr:ATP-binding protein [Erysipelothrix sp.]